MNEVQKSRNDVVVVVQLAAASFRCCTNSRRLASCSLEHFSRNSFLSSRDFNISSHLDCLVTSSSCTLGNEDSTNIRPTDEYTLRKLKYKTKSDKSQMEMLNRNRLNEKLKMQNFSGLIDEPGF